MGSLLSGTMHCGSEQQMTSLRKASLTLFLLVSPFSSLLLVDLLLPSLASELSDALTTFIDVIAEEMVVVEGQICETPSTRFNGLCFSGNNCASGCHGEGFPDGDCEGVHRRCICRKPC